MRVSIILSEENKVSRKISKDLRKYAHMSAPLWVLMASLAMKL